ncbi:metal ABC transporter solute-binding protein, Zn/Mn family [Bacillus norwichensis]|uniref:Zinc ABC transporter substrate-binding protein n=1 Tax=Bacillus norwichensis TaxID=2762217 RepID=A0ABR8VPG7_9BACI|nr:zinc ABC transporter substrate-binding protein [Bacillus norwichensis]MBD8006660.1 zinc ABC transporter substrate-binding protein [Bacillus norwichensis]
MRTKRFFIALFLITAFILAGCGKEPGQINQNNKNTLSVYTTIFPIEDFAKKIGGDHVEVKSVYPAGADAHTYEPTMKTMMDIADSDLLIYNGAGLEAFIEKMENSLKNEKVLKVEASKGVKLLSSTEGHEHGENDHDDGHHHDKDPHIWIDPENAIMMAENIKNALTEKMPSAKDDFENNYQELKEKLEQLDKDLSTVIESADRKELLVSHAAYGYWEHRYGLEQISITGISSENEPSQKQLQDIIETAKEHQIKYIIYNQNPSTKVVDTIQKETGTKPLTLHNLEYIIQKDKENKEDYFSIMDKNIETLKKALSK